jgi:hypothetical protein
VQNHHDPVTRQSDVEFQTVGPAGERSIEGRGRVLGRKRGPAAVREDERPIG